MGANGSACWTSVETNRTDDNGVNSNAKATRSIPYLVLRLHFVTSSTADSFMGARPLSRRFRALVQPGVLKATRNSNPAYANLLGGLGRIQGNPLRNPQTERVRRLIGRDHPRRGGRMRLRNKTAIVTGGGAGIGEAIALRYALEGARVVVAEINPPRGKSTVDAIHKQGGQGIFVPTDVSSEEQVKRMVESAIETFGRVDILVNNAAILIPQGEGRVHELTNEVWDRTINTNLRGYWLCAKYTIPYMLKQGKGSIILVASRTGIRGFTGLAAYSASKGGVLALMRSMAADYARDGIQVNAIVPGTMDTPMNAEGLSDPGVRAKYVSRIPAGRLGVGADIAGMATFLATEEASFCIGGVYMVDGGADLG